MSRLIAQRGGFKLVDSPQRAHVVLVHTSAALASEVEGSLDLVLEMAERKNAGQLERLIVTGELVQRYAAALEENIPEIDAMLGLGSISRVVDALHGGFKQKTLVGRESFILSDKSPCSACLAGSSAYMRIAQGCARSCSFCMIPQLRGPQQSRSVKDLIREAKILADGGIKELILFAHETNAYGREQPGAGEEDQLVRLLSELEREVPQIAWIRLLNLYPQGISDELIELMQRSERLLPYVDLPFQHISQRVLSSMDRGASCEEQRSLVERLRAIDDLVLRSRFIVGYPGESAQEFQELYDWVAALKLDGAEVYAFSPEEGTAAAQMPGQVAPEVIEARQAALKKLQHEISLAKNQEWIGAEVEIIVDGMSPEHEAVLQGRHYGQAPRRDGVVYLSFDYGGEPPAPGEFVEVEITQATARDLGGIVLPAG